MSDEVDPILDALLSEVLGGQTPPDLSARIVQAWVARGDNAERIDYRLLEALHGLPVPPPLASEAQWQEPVAPPVQNGVHANGNGATSAPLVAAAATSRKPMKAKSRATRRRNTAWLSAAIAASLIVAGGVTVYVTYQSQHTPLANTNRSTDKPAPPTDLAQGQLPIKPEKTVILPDHLPVLPEKTFPGNSNTSPDPRPTVIVRKLPQSAWENLKPSSTQDIVAFIGTSMRDAWQASKVESSPAATDAQWCRRVYQRLIGRAPTTEELASFEGNKNSDKRETLVNRLLNDSKYASEFNEHWSKELTVAWLGREVPADDSQRSRVEGLQKYVREALAANKPYNKIVSELIAATGTGRENAANHNGAANFLLANQNNDATLATTRVSSAFLGKRLQCAQCHDDPASGHTQQQFWAMNAYFRQMATDRQSGATTLVNRDFRGQSGHAAEADLFYETRDGKLKVAYPTFIDGTPSPRSGLVKDINRREELAALMAASDDLSRAMVNRTWAAMFGYGFTQPVDDMGSHNPATHPEILERLAREFKAHDYNTKDLLRWVALSEPFGLSTKPLPKNMQDAPRLGTAPLFTYYYGPAPAGEPLQQSLVATVQIAKTGGTLNDKDQARLAWLGQIAQARKTNSVDDEPMAIASELILPSLSDEQSALLKKVSESKLTAAQKVEHLYLAAIARSPNRRELEVTQQIIAANKGDVNQALPDIWWALMNSNEFLLGR